MLASAVAFLPRHTFARVLIGSERPGPVVFPFGAVANGSFSFLHAADFACMPGSLETCFAPAKSVFSDTAYVSAAPPENVVSEERRCFHCVVVVVAASWAVSAVTAMVVMMVALTAPAEMHAASLTASAETTLQQQCR